MWQVIYLFFNVLLHHKTGIICSSLFYTPTEPPHYKREEEGPSSTPFPSYRFLSPAVPESTSLFPSIHGPFYLCLILLPRFVFLSSAFPLFRSFCGSMSRERKGLAPTPRGRESADTGGWGPTFPVTLGASQGLNMQVTDRPLFSPVAPEGVGTRVGPWDHGFLYPQDRPILFPHSILRLRTPEKLRKSPPLGYQDRPVGETSTVLPPGTRHPPPPPGNRWVPPQPPFTRCN